MEITFSATKLFCDIETKQLPETMAPSNSGSESNDDYHSDTSDLNKLETEDRAPKRRRLSEFDEDDEDGFIAPAPLPTLSRIKKKDEVKKSETTKEEEPVTIREALEIGLRAEQSTFGALNVSPWLVGSLTTMAIRRPTAIQKACIPEILKGRDCIGGSRTGSGKTMAFAVPIIQKWAQDPFGVFAVVLTPTRYVGFLFFLFFFALHWRNHASRSFYFI